MRVAFFGSSRFSCLVLRALCDSAHEPVVAVTQPDHRAGRGMMLCPTVVCTDSEQIGLPVLKPERVKGNPEFRKALMAHRPEALLLASYGQLISKKVLALTEWPLNVHPSLLPKLRGASPIRAALLQGLGETGCCVMKMTPRLDDGDLLCCEELALESDWNYAKLEEELGSLGGRLALRALDSIVEGSVTLSAQDHAAATYTSTFQRDDTWIDWARPAREVGDFVRAWDPDVGACTTLPDGSRVKVWKARVQDLPPEVDKAGGEHPAPGTVVAVTKKAFWVAAVGGVLRLAEIQPENHARMSVGSFLAGHKIAGGERLGVARR